MPILHIRDENGNFVHIPAIKGDDGKSAYEQAVEGGFQGTEEEFVALLNSFNTEHFTDFNNPHNVTKEQLDAFSIYGGTISGNVNVYNSTNPELQIGVDGANSAVFRYTENKTVDMYNQTGGQPTAISLGNASVMELKDVVKLWVGATDYRIYGDHNASELGFVTTATGSYDGAGTHGVTKPNTLTFPFVPKVVFISPSTKTTGAPFAWIYGSPVGLVNYNNGAAYTSSLTWDNNTLTWYTSDGYPAYQHNNTGITYYWIAFG